MDFNNSTFIVKLSMPQSRKRHGHHPYQKSSAIPAKQRTKGRVTWAILFAVFGFLITFFAAGSNLILLSIVTIIAALIGYIIGRNLEKNV
jgi:hypothetical protein